MDISFDSQGILTAAAEFQGLDDFGDPGFKAGLAALLATYDQHVDSEESRQRVYMRVLKVLGARLRVEQAKKRHPEIAAEQISQPMILTGLPRTGTSALFNLLSVDPASRALLQWETHYPDPVEGLAAGEMDPRHRKLVEKIEAQKAQNPEFQTMHFASADTPEECVLLHSLAFNGVQLGFECMLEPYQSWHQSSDLLPMYQYYLELLKMLQWRRPGDRWLLKAPAHMWGLDSLIHVMPDACILWGHRDPLQVIPSISSLTAMAAKMFAGHIPAMEKDKLGPLVMEFYARSLERGIATRSKITAKHFFDYRFKDFVDKPLTLIRDTYDFFKLPLDDDLNNRFTDYIEQHPKGKHGDHRYTFETFGLTEAMILERFEFYYQHPVYSHYL